MKIGREDFEAFLKGEKDIRPYIELDPVAGSYSVFGVKTASNPNYLVKAIYEMYESNLDKKLAVQAVRKLFRSVGMGSVGLNNLLKKLDLNLSPAEFLMLVFKLQHQQGWGAPFELIEQSDKRIRLRTKQTFESQIMKDWNMAVCGIHQGWIEGILFAATGKNWFCLETKCHAKGDDVCEFVADQVESSWRFKAQAIVKGDSAITEYIEHKPLNGTIKLIDDPVVMMPRFIFTSMMNSLKKTMGEMPAGGVNYRAYMEMGKENVEHYKKMGIDKPNILSDMAFAFYSQMGWFSVLKTEWNEATKTKTMTLTHTVESEAFGNTGKNVCFCTAGLLAGIIEGSFGIKVQAKEIKCRSKGDEYCVFAITNKTENSQ
ncbi:MAG: V4R domain-containing protein [Methanoregula sp.]|uniref:V4R domain-containing protein n=1 Tax=Methanoregula sp. TaxID=2052170 RepID=UPI003C386951